MPELSISFAPFGQQIWAWFPDLNGYRLVTRFGLPTGADIWSGDHGLVLTPNGPTRFRVVHETSRSLH